ncbi:MAG: DUF308 domain-containing protein [Clostridia bacterium]|nr:DUF308 domain-containing protein [Clostridia bacterium]
MNTLFKKLRQELFILSIAFVLLGLTIIFFSSYVRFFAGFATGVIILFFGIKRIVEYFRERSSEYSSPLSLAWGILLSLAGVFVIATPGIIGKYIFSLLGILIIISGAINLARTAEIHKNQQKGYIFPMIFSVFIIVAGIFICFNQNEMTNIAIKMLGIIFVLIGSTNMITSLYVKQIEELAGSNDEIEVESNGVEYKDD